MNKKAVFFFLIAFFLILALAASLFFFFEKEKFLSPLSSQKSFSSSNESQKLVIGFLPFWTLKEESNFRFELLDQIIYMGVEFNEEGEIVKKTNNYLEPGWSGFQSDRFQAVIEKAKKKNTKVVLGIQNYTSKTIEEILKSEKAQEKIISSSISLVKEKDLDGMNIDFEYSGTNMSSLKESFSNFVEKFKNELEKQDKDYVLSIDVFADSITRNRIYDIGKLSSLCDQIIIMGYDFHRASSVNAGPIAPLRSNSPYSILSTLDDFFTQADRKKLILAVAYYGYEWPTLSEEFASLVYGNQGALATYKRTMALIEEKSLSVNWDELSMSPWLVHKDQGKTKQIYFENEKSLGLKYQLVKQADLAGVAIWALGYDGERKELWQLLEKSF